MDMLAAWLLFPLVALVVSTGIGLLVERLSGVPVPGVLVVPMGIASLVVASQITTYWSATAPATLPLVVILAAAGWAVGARRGRRPDAWALGTAVGVFCAFGAPVVMSGDATFAGYTLLGDTVVHLLGADALIAHGRDFAGMAPSDAQFVLSAYFEGNAYPSGASTALAVLTSLVNLDSAWTFQPFLSLLPAGGALCAYALAEPLVPSRAARAAVAFVSAQPALLYAYVMQGSVKEVGMALALALAAALIAAGAARGRESPRRVIPLAISCAAAFAFVGAAAVVWLGPLAVCAVAAALVATPAAERKRLAGGAGLFVALVILLSYQAILPLGTYVEVAGGVVTAAGEMGNLLQPLDPLQALGIWPTGDYRLDLERDRFVVTAGLLGVLVGALGLGAHAVARRRPIGLATLLVASLVGSGYVLWRGSPWADGKALMIGSPAVLLLAIVGAAAFGARGRRAEGVVIGAVIAGGVLWSNALAYRDAALAPGARMQELHDVGGRIAGRGPTLYPEFEEFAKHFLRDGRPFGPAESLQPGAGATGRDGRLVPRSIGIDLDQLSDAYLLRFQTIVLRRGFGSSRPPSPFRRTWRGRFYDIWQATAAGRARIVEHLAGGGRRAPAAPVDCEDIRRLAERAGQERATLIVAERPRNVLALPGQVSRPEGWPVDRTDPAAVVLHRRDRLSLRLDVPRAGRYDLWLEGSVGGSVTVAIDGRRVGRVAHRLNYRGSAEHVEQVQLRPGPRDVTVAGGGPEGLRPGSGRFGLLGPVALTSADPTALPLRTLPSGRWRELCGRSLDWVEAVAPAG